MNGGRIYTTNSQNLDTSSSKPFTVTDIGTVTDSSSSNSSKSSSKDYSTTNIQVENVDEADITKTDGDYIYSISEDNVVITNVMDPEHIKIESILKSNDLSYPEDLLIYNNKLVVISTYSGTGIYPNSSSNNTIVKVYDLTNKSKPNLVKSYELYEPYYTSRCIDNMLYVISSGKLRIEDDEVLRGYKEDSMEKEIKLKNIKYLKNVKTDKQTLISSLDLNNIEKDINLVSYLVDVTNAYISEESIYLMDEKYDGESNLSIGKMFGFKGIFGLFDFKYTNSYVTEIYKFDILKNGQVRYKAKNKIEGKTINQYSLDEKDGHLRIAVSNNKGSRIGIFDKNLKIIGTSNYVAKGEKMYSTRFMGNKAYLVTYKTIDPLFVFDLSDEKKPRVLGELKIPGYSTYLHPYDENHLIGIGMETEEIVNKNSTGRITSVRAQITGMKMALFDVSDVKNPIQMSAILTNPKALLFSKEKELIAIPVNNYNEDFHLESSDSEYSSLINAYKNYNKKYVSEGYFVYKLNLNEGFNLKGVITHQSSEKKKSNYYNYNNSRLLRGMYIDNNLYTVSEDAIKVNNLDTLDLVDELKIKE